MKYTAVSEDGKFCIITVEEVGQSVLPASTPPPEPKPIKVKGHVLKPTNPADPTSPIICSCGAEGYVCRKCMKVLCSGLTPPVDEVCPACTKAGK